MSVYVLFWFSVSLVVFADWRMMGGASTRSSWEEGMGVPNSGTQDEITVAFGMPVETVMLYVFVQK